MTDERCENVPVLSLHRDPWRVFWRYQPQTKARVTGLPDGLRPYDPARTASRWFLAGFGF